MLARGCWLQQVIGKNGMINGFRENPLQVGQLVYHWDLGVRGRHKLHDKWSPVLYQVLKAPVGHGAVYTIAPAEELHKARHIHRDMIKARVRTNICLPSLHSPPASTAPVISSDSPEDGELWLPTRDSSAISVTEAIVPPCSTGSSAAPPVIAALDSVPSVEPEHTECQLCVTLAMLLLANIPTSITFLNQCQVEGTRALEPACSGVNVQALLLYLFLLGLGPQGLFGFVVEATTQKVEKECDRLIVCPPPLLTANRCTQLPRCLHLGLGTLPFPACSCCVTLVCGAPLKLVWWPLFTITLAGDWC